uniref:Putative glutathione s-transferase n=1 Tax=Ixodes ricinus TaxID=34613 RepID=V5HK86_IXORI
MPVVLYSCEPSAPCRVVRMVAKHIGLPLTIKEVDIPAGDTKKEDFPLSLNPALHLSPLWSMVSLVLFESRAIVTYLVDKYAAGSPLYPHDIEKRAVINNLLIVLTLAPSTRPCLPTSTRSCFSRRNTTPLPRPQ